MIGKGTVMNVDLLMLLLSLQEFLHFVLLFFHARTTVKNLKAHASIFCLLKWLGIMSFVTWLVELWLIKEGMIIKTSNATGYDYKN